MIYSYLHIYVFSNDNACLLRVVFATASKRIEEQGLTGVWVNTGQPRLSAIQGMNQGMTGIEATGQDKGKDSKIAAIGIKLRR